MKKLLSILLSLTMILVTLPMVFAEESEVYEISTSGQLREFLNSGNTYESVTVKLTSDIKIYGKEFSVDENNVPKFNGTTVLPVAFPSLENFKGTFDGQNYTISGLYLNDALFKNCDGATIKNLNIENSLVVNETVNKYGLATIGSIIKNTTVTGCSVDAIVIGGGNNVAGVVGKITDSTVMQCRNLGEVYGNNYVGGVVGSINSSNVIECYNSADIVGNDSVGGFAGHTYNSLIGSCYNLGDVTALGDRGTAGGFIGYLNPKVSNGDTITYVYTTGEVFGDKPGKFCGFFVGSYQEMFAISGCYFVGDSLREFDYNGSVYSLWNRYKDNPSIMYPPGSIHVAVVNSIGIYPRTDAQLKDSRYSYSYNFVYDFSNENQGYPMMEYFHKIHTFSEYKTSADGTEMVAKCNSTGCDMTDSYPHNHIWSDYVYNNDASCVKAGTMSAVCLDPDCGMTKTVDDPDHPKTGHTWGEYVYNQDATCVKAGTMTSWCTVEGCNTKNTIADPDHQTADHIFGEYVLNSDGLTEIAHCRQNGCVATDTKAHTHIWRKYVYNNDADCITNGTKTAHCFDENCKATDTIADPDHTATGHKMSEYTLNTDGKTETSVCLNDGCSESVIIEHNHSWGKYEGNNDADCTTDGTMTAHCTKHGCTATDTQKDPDNKATGHEYSEWESNEDAKLFKNATETRTCSCGHSQTQEIEHSSKIVVFFREVAKFFETLFG